MNDVHPIDCAAFGDKLPLYVGGDLDSELLAHCDAHLAGCSACQAALVRANRARQTYFEVSHASVAQDLADLNLYLWPAVRDGLRAEGLLGERPEPLALGLPSEAASEGRPTLALRSGYRWLPGGALAAAAALLAVFVWPTGGADEGRAGGRAEPAVAVSDPGGLTVHSAGAPAGGEAVARPATLAADVVAQPADLGQAAPEARGLVPVDFADSLIYEALMRQNGSAPMQRMQPDQLASEYWFPLR
jgi:hypothetical protein